MASPQKKHLKKVKPAADSLAHVELSPDAWPRFEKLIKSAAKMGHKPHKEVDSANLPRKPRPRGHRKS